MTENCPITKKPCGKIIENETVLEKVVKLFNEKKTSGIMGTIPGSIEYLRISYIPFSACNTCKNKVEKILSASNSVSTSDTTQS
jgi:hypothetical protein